MRHWRLIVLGLVLWLAGLLPAVAAERTRQDAARDYGDVYFWTADAGIVGDGRELVLTRDGGQTWTPLLSAYGPNPGPASIDNFGVLNAQVWWFQDSGYLWQTVDQGQTWTKRPLADFGEPIFVSPTAAWAIRGDSEVLGYTNDGGQTWHSKVLTSVNPLCFKIIRLVFASPAVGWAECRDNTLLQTSDAGQIWVSRGQLPSYIPLLFFLDPSNGYTLDIKAPRIWFTHDGGATWQPASLPPLPNKNPLESLRIPGSPALWAGGNGILAGGL